MRHENLIISKTVAGRRNGQLIVVQEVGGDQLQSRVSTGKAVADMARIFSTVIIGVSFMSHG